MDIYMTNEWRDWTPTGEVHMENGRMVRDMMREGVVKSARVYNNMEMRAMQDADTLAMKMPEMSAAAKTWGKDNGFDWRGITYCAVGETFPIKDKLKNMGYLYHPTLGWHGSDTLSLPSGYKLIPISFDEAFVWNTETKKADPYEIVKKLKEAIKESQWIGDIGDKVTNLTVTLINVKSTINKFNKLSNFYTFKQNDNILVWSTTSEIDAEIGDEILITSASIKQLVEYNNIKKTQLKLVKWTKV